MPNAIDGTIIGMLIRVSNIAESHLPKVLRVIKIAIGKPRAMPKTVTIAPKTYESVKLCQ